MKVSIYHRRRFHSDVIRCGPETIIKLRPNL